MIARPSPLLVLFPLLLATTCQSGGPGLGIYEPPDQVMNAPPASAPASAPSPVNLDGVWRVEMAAFDVFCLLIAEQRIEIYQPGCAASLQQAATLVNLQSEIGGVVEFNSEIPFGPGAAVAPVNYRLYITSKPSDYVWAVTCIRTIVPPGLPPIVSAAETGIMSRI